MFAREVPVACLTLDPWRGRSERGSLITGRRTDPAFLTWATLLSMSVQHKGEGEPSRKPEERASQLQGSQVSTGSGDSVTVREQPPRATSVRSKMGSKTSPILQQRYLLCAGLSQQSKALSGALVTCAQNFLWLTVSALIISQAHLK